MSKSSRSKSLRAVQSARENEGVGVQHYIFFILGILYGVLPVDILPDLPIVGWFDDITLIATTGLNLLQQHVSQTNEALGNIIKGLKWVIIILGGIAVLLALLLGALIVGLITKLFS